MAISPPCQPLPAVGAVRLLLLASRAAAHAAHFPSPGLECDVGICAGNALFKSAVLGLLAHVSGSRRRGRKRSHAQQNQLRATCLRLLGRPALTDKTPSCRLLHWPKPHAPPSLPAVRLEVGTLGGAVVSCHTSTLTGAPQCLPPTHIAVRLAGGGAGATGQGLGAALPDQ